MTNETPERVVTYLGPNVSTRLQFVGGDAKRLKRRGLPLMKSFADIAAALGVSESHLVWLTYCDRVVTTDHYRRFSIPKRSGGVRPIAQPLPHLAKAQQWIAREILSKCYVNDSAMAFRQGMSIVDNADRHVGKALVLRIDIKDFFSSIKFERVRGLFESLGYNPGVATVLAILCTDDVPQQVSLKSFKGLVRTGTRRLPQGACTSPLLANIIASRLDRRIQAVMKSQRDDVGDWAYTRYADDLVLSTQETDIRSGMVTRIVRQIVRAEGFEVNEKKTRVMRAPARQMVTGLVVGDAVRLPRSYLRRVRAQLHRVQTLLMTSVEVDSAELHVARGHYAYICMVMPEHAAKMRSQYPWLAR